MNKRFAIKIIILLIVACFVYGSRIYFDTFNIFHWKNIRFIEATPNRNFIKTKYILNEPAKFNAFLFGSSRIGPMPPDFLPKEYKGEKLSWYNMTYPTGIPKENLETVKTFLKNNVKIKVAIVQFDDIALQVSPEEHKNTHFCMPYQIYEKNKILFYLNFLKIKTDSSIVKQVIAYDKTQHKTDSKNFYSYGIYDIEMDNTSILTPEKEKDHKRYNSYDIQAFSEKNSYKDIEELVELCNENNIELILITTPLYKTAYNIAVDNGYLNFLRDVAQNCVFYNFSSINKYTTDYKYYFESIHYRPALGLIIEKMLFGSEEEKEQIRKDAGDKLWGIKVNSDNVDFVIQELKKQIPD